MDQDPFKKEVQDRDFIKIVNQINILPLYTDIDYFFFILIRNCIFSVLIFRSISGLAVLYCF